MRARRQPRQQVDNAQSDGDNDKSESSGSDVNNDKDDDDCDKFKEGKEPMSPELY
jgi:hypothetical protein